MKQPKIAIVHDWINGFRGGERCLFSLLKLFPDADIFTLFFEKGKVPVEIESRVKKVSFLQSFPGAAKMYRHLLPLYPFAIKRFDFTGYDLIISLSHAAAKNITPPIGVPHLCYCFTPMRYVWDQKDFYFGSKTKILEPILSMLRAWDIAGAKRVSHFVGISTFVSARIRAFYQRTSSVIFPPVYVDKIPLSTEKREGFLYAGALVPYKRPEVAIRAAVLLQEKITVIGKGPMRESLQEEFKNSPYVIFAEAHSDQEMYQYYGKARALLFPGIEDFGIVPLEAFAAGTPVIALHAGAAKETLKPYATFFSKREEPVAGLCRAIKKFAENEATVDRNALRAHAQKFSEARFLEEMKDVIGKIGNYTEGTEIHREPQRKI